MPYYVTRAIPQADAVEAQLIKLQSYTNGLELENARLKASHSKDEQRAAKKRDWAEKRLSEEESTISSLQSQVRALEAAMAAQKAEHSRYAESCDKEFKNQQRVIDTMKETYRKRLAEAEEGRLNAAKQTRALQNAQASDVFKAFDANGDGVMDEAEFAAAFATFNKPKANPFPDPASGEGRFDYQKNLFVALYDCPADSSDELSFRAGDILTVIAEGEKGWVIARLGDSEGMVPANYIRPFKGGQ